MRHSLAILLLVLTSTPTHAGPQLQVGMTLDDAVAALESVGSAKVRGAYSLPWSESNDIGPDDPLPQWWRHGHHVYCHLPDGTCLSLRVEAFPEPKPTRVVGMQLGVPGERYVGKFEWYTSRDAGRHTYPEVIDLSDYSRGFLWPWFVGTMSLIACLIVLRRERMKTGIHRRLQLTGDARGEVIR